MIFQKELLESFSRYGERIAIEGAGKLIGYASLLKMADKVTGCLLDRKLEMETFVGVQLKDRADMVCAMIGIMNSRCVFIPIDEGLPVGRLEGMIADLELKWMISSRRSPGKTPEGGWPGITTLYIEDILGEEQEDIPGEGQEDIPGEEQEDAGVKVGEDAIRCREYPDFNEDDSLYVYFTSGSTGTPKGIIGKNKSLLQFVKWEIAAFGVEATSRFSQLISPYFDAFLRDIFTPLLAGGTICLPDEEEDFLTPEKLVSWIGRSRITLIHCVPSVFRIINRSPLSAGQFRELKYILLSGEKIIPLELVNWYNVFGDAVQLVNLYGTTETTMIRSYYKISPEDTAKSRIPIGYPIDDTAFLILNKEGKPCNILVPGELYILSDYLTKGYLNAHELNREKFVRLETGVTGGSPAFRTGDSARRLADGKIDLIGRVDRQVKMNGIRIEPDEIENRIFRSGLVGQAVVVKANPENGSEALIAFVTSQEGRSAGPPITPRLTHYLKQYLPHYMMPSEIVEVDEFPMLGNGKINYQQLLNKVANAALILPVNETQEKILAVWKEIVGERPISVRDPFQRVGGNSLGIMRLIGRIHKEFNIRVSLSDLFNNPTIEAQAEIVGRAARHTKLEILPAGEKVAYNLSSLQERACGSDKGRHWQMSWELPEGTCLEKMEDAFQRLMERHEVLRTRFISMNGRHSQVIGEQTEFRWESWEGPEEGEGGAFNRPFELDRAPLMRCAIQSGREGKNMLRVALHPAIGDPDTQINLYKDWVRFYNGEKPEPLRLQYKDYAEWEYGFRSTEEYISCREFWLSRFEQGLPELGLPVMGPGIFQPGKPGSEVMEKAGKAGQMELTMSLSVMQPLLDRMEREGIPVYAGFLSLYFLFLFQLTGQEDIVVGINLPGRTQKGMEEIAGPFMRTLAFRQGLDPEASFWSLAKSVQEGLGQARRKQFYDHDDALQEMNKAGNGPYDQMFETMYEYRDDVTALGVIGDSSFPGFRLENPVPDLPISLNILRTGGAFHFRFGFLPGHFTLSDIGLLTAPFPSLINKISEHPDTHIMDHIGGGMHPFNIREDNITFSF